MLKGLKYILFADKKNSKEGISSFKSLMTILAGTLGTGNIIGIATAITIGGIGSIFWIFISGVFAIATKYAETFIVLKYRKKDKSGFTGGTMYVLRDRIGSSLLAFLFSIFVIVASFGIGCMIQSNAISVSVLESFNINKYLLAIVITVLCSYAIFGNEKRISNVSSILIPVATLIYIFMCTYLLYVFKDNILNSIILIFNEAFNFKSAAGGIFSAFTIKAINEGLSKGLFSNEAGLGSSPLFDLSVKEVNIKKQSIISSTSVFIDTVCLCTLTGIVIVASGLYRLTDNPVSLIQQVFGKIPYGGYLLTFSLASFAIATIPCWSYYGNMGVRYIFKTKTIYQLLYKVMYTICVFIGAICTIQEVWSIANIANALMALPNIYMIYYLRKEVT
ncbi:Amino-acid carrier protein AlsT [compost metagenome]